MSSDVIRVSGVIFRDPHHHVLTVRKRGTDRFMLPGGKPEAGEKPTATAVREVQEELGITLNPADLIPLGQFQAPAANEANHTVASTVFLAPPLPGDAGAGASVPREDARATGTPRPAAEIEDIAWVDPRQPREDLAPLLTDEVFPALMEQPVRSLGVFMGARFGADPAHRELARQLGSVMASTHTNLVYGGGKVGLMGSVADAVLESGGTATGVIPQHLVDREVAHPGLTRLEVVPSLNERKQRMNALADGFVCLPGGAGTLDEFFDTWTGQQLGEHTKPIALLGRKFWAPTLAMIDHMVDQGFIRQEDRATLIVADSAAELFDGFAAWRPPTPKWA